MNELIINEIAKDLNVRVKQVETVLNLLSDGNTIPFIINISSLVNFSPSKNFSIRASSVVATASINAEVISSITLSSGTGTLVALPFSSYENAIPVIRLT